MIYQVTVAKVTVDELEHQFVEGIGGALAAVGQLVDAWGLEPPEQFAVQRSPETGELFQIAFSRVATAEGEYEEV